MNVKEFKRLRAALSDAQKANLRSVLLDWVRVTLHLSTRLEGIVGDKHIYEAGLDLKVIRLHQVVMADVHFTLIAINQVAQHLRWLKDSWHGPLRQAADEFDEQFRSSVLEIMRDLAEHRDEYLAGAGRYPKHVVDPGSLLKVGYGNPSLGAPRLTLGSAGNEFVMDGILTALRHLKDALET